MPRKSAAPPVDDELDEFDDLEVEEDEEVEDEEAEDLEDETDEDEEPEEKPARRRKTQKRATATKGKTTKKTSASSNGKPVFGTSELLEHVNAKTGKSLDAKSLRVHLRKLAEEGVVERVVGEDRARYSFTGVNDPQVRAVVQAVKAATVKRPQRASKNAEVEDDEEETPRRRTSTRKPAAKTPAKKPMTARKRTAATKSTSKPATRRRRSKPADEEVEDLD